MSHGPTKGWAETVVRRGFSTFSAELKRYERRQPAISPTASLSNGIQGIRTRNAWFPPGIGWRFRRIHPSRENPARSDRWRRHRSGKECRRWRNRDFDRPAKSTPRIKANGDRRIIANCLICRPVPATNISSTTIAGTKKSTIIKSRARNSRAHDAWCMVPKEAVTVFVDSPQFNLYNSAEFAEKPRWGILLVDHLPGIVIRGHVEIACPLWGAL